LASNPRLLAIAAMIGIIEACCCSRGGPVTLRDRVCIAKDSDKLAAILRQRLDAAAKVAISTRGHFALAIPGGSVLDLLKGWTPEWSSKAVVAYVNHKCVPSDDPKNSTHAKAVRSFLSGWPGVTIVEPAPSNLLVDSAAEAYADKLAAVPEAMLPCAGGLPCFDVMLLGMGDDGHIGSLHPYREEILTSGPWVLPVAKGSPASITMSLPVMTAARDVIVAAFGVSEKAPDGKAEAAFRAIEGPDETPETLPASALRGSATWLLDEVAAEKLSPLYRSPSWPDDIAAKLSSAGYRRSRSEM